MLCSNHPAPTVIRVSGITVTYATFDSATKRSDTGTMMKAIAAADQVALLWSILDRCVVLAEQRARARFNGSNDGDDIPAALTVLNIQFLAWPRPITSIFGPLAANYPQLVHALQVLSISHNNHDDSAGLGAFATLAKHLRELTLYEYNISSLQGLKGHCELLRKVDFSDCEQLCDLEGLEDHLLLEEVILSGAEEITSIEPLRTCPDLTIVDLCLCQELSSIAGLEGHQWLREVSLPATGVTSIEPLRTCPALITVDITGCLGLASLEGLEGHQWLEEVAAGGCAYITSIDPLRTCPALAKVKLDGCERVSSIEALEGHPQLQVVDASTTALTSVKPLRTCPALTTVLLANCSRLSSMEGLEDHEYLQEVNVTNTNLSSIDILRSCPALTKVVCRCCPHLPGPVTFPFKVIV